MEEPANSREHLVDQSAQTIETGEWTETFKGLPEDLVDVTLLVEGKELCVNRAVLAHYSPVFHKMFFSLFMEATQRIVPLPAETYEEIVMFLNVLLPRTAALTPRESCPITDENLLPLLALADKYDTEEVTVRCEDYIGKCLGHYFYNFYKHYTGPACTERWTLLREGRLLVEVTDVKLPIPRDDTGGQEQDKGQLLDRFSLYVRACDAYRLQANKGAVMTMFINLCYCKKDLCGAEHYQFLSPSMKVELLERMCCKLEERTESMRQGRGEDCGELVVRTEW